MGNDCGSTAGQRTFRAAVTSSSVEIQSKTDDTHQHPVDHQETLEALLVIGPSTEEKWAAIHQIALALMPKAAQHDTAVAKWEWACDQAFAESDVRFRIEELDEVLDTL